MSKTEFKVALVGPHGYTGQVLHALLMQHPGFLPVPVTAKSPGELAADAFDAIASADAVALAVPTEAAIEWITALKTKGARRILDLSDSQRCNPEVHYGLPELYGPPPLDATVVANPGCYPTAALLALAPIVKAGLCAKDSIAIHGLSGASGAGKALADHLHFCNLAENVFPYKVGDHKHTPEIEAHLGAPVSLVTTLLPIVRGLCITAWIRPKVSPSALREFLLCAHADHQYVTILGTPDQALGLRHVVGSHQAIVAVGPVERSGLVPVFCSIDNLMRGAASQALVNLNTWVGFRADLGLPLPLTPRLDLPPVFASQFSIESGA